MSSSQSLLNILLMSLPSGSWIPWRKHRNCLRERVYFMVQSLQSTQPHAQGGEGGPHLPGPASALGPDVIRGLETHPIQGFHWARRVMMSSSISKGSTMEAYLRKGWPFLSNKIWKGNQLIISKMISVQSLEDTQVGYILQKYTFAKIHFLKILFQKILSQKIHFQVCCSLED